MREDRIEVVPRKDNNVINLDGKEISKKCETVTRRSPERFVQRLQIHNEGQSIFMAK